MRHRSRCTLLLAFALTLTSIACSTTPAAAPAAREVVAPLETKAAPPKSQGHAPDEPSPGFRLPSDTTPLSYALHFNIDPTQETFSGTAIIKVRLAQARRTIWFHARGLSVSSASVNGKSARFAQVDEDGMARVALDAPVSGDVDVAIAWSAKFNPALEAVYRVQFEERWYAFTQFEAISARDAFPCFDEPGFKTPFTLSFTTKKDDVVVANTMPLKSAPDGVGVRTDFNTTQPLPVYLLAWAVGPLDIVEGQPLAATAQRKEPVPVRGIATKGKGPLLVKSIETSRRTLEVLEAYFDVPYPYGKMDIVAVPDFAAGAMENAGLVTYRDALLFVDEKSPLGLQKGNIHVIAHENAHQWFGNYVTLAWWDDIWLNEAFASWTQTWVVDTLRPDLNARTDARSSADWVMGEDSLVSARQIRQPVLSKGDIINAFDGITYTKGASVIAMFESWLGADVFKQGVRAYLKEHAHGTAVAADLMRALGAASAKDVATPFSTFLDQPGVPFIEADVKCAAGGKTPASVELKQSRWLPVGSTGDVNKTWQVPVCVRADGAAAKCTLLTTKTGALALDKCPKSWTHPNDDGRGYYRWALPAEQLRQVSSSLPKLTPGERISFGNAVRASAWTGKLSFKDALEASLPLAKDLDASVADTPFGFYSFAWNDLVEDAARPKVQKAAADLYRPMLDAVKLQPQPKEEPRTRERRTLALSALAFAEDPKTEKELAKLGDAVLAGDRVDLTKVHGDLAAMSIAMSVKAGGAKAWDAAAARLSSESDSLVRNYLLGALGRVDDPALSQKAIALSLDKRLKVNEVLSPLWGQASDPRTRDAVWAWLSAHVDELVDRLPETFGAAALPSLFSGYCTVEKAAEVEKFFAPRKEIPGLERELAQTLENIRLCAAKKAVHAESARKMFPAK